ncbi:MAG: FRG domain-containing protein [Blastocatellia bacterium]
MVQEIRISDWRELTERVYEGSWEAGIARFRPNVAFRGLSDADYALKSGLIRLGGPTEKLEGHLLRNFRKYARRDSVPDSIWDWMALSQHHGLPTRLIDWTYSPYVAMHFATARLEDFDTDGVIWSVDFAKANELIPKKLKQVLREEGSYTITVEMLNSIARTPAEFDRLADDPFVVFFEPPSLDDRIVNQFALFSLMSSPTAALDDWLNQHPELCRKIIIPAEAKWEVRDKLDQANITERVLLPGLDGLSSWLKRYYTPRRQGGKLERGEESKPPMAKETTGNESL